MSSLPFLIQTTAAGESPNQNKQTSKVKTITAVQVEQMTPSPSTMTFRPDGLTILPPSAMYASPTNTPCISVRGTSNWLRVGGKQKEPSHFLLMRGSWLQVHPFTAGEGTAAPSWLILPASVLPHRAGPCSSILLADEYKADCLI